MSRPEWFTCSYCLWDDMCMKKHDYGSAYCREWVCERCWEDWFVFINHNSCKPALFREDTG